MWLIFWKWLISENKILKAWEKRQKEPGWKALESLRENSKALE